MFKSMPLTPIFFEKLILGIAFFFLKSPFQLLVEQLIVINTHARILMVRLDRTCYKLINSNMFLLLASWFFKHMYELSNAM